MKKILLSLAVLALTTAVNAQTLTLEQVIAKNIEARGGLEKLNKLN